MMTTTYPHPEARHSFTDPEAASTRHGAAEPTQGPALADAEEEEFVELWAHDPGNQGA